MDYKTLIFIILAIVVAHFIFAVGWLIYKMRKPKK
jgi:hypothetical protein